MKKTIFRIAFFLILLLLVLGYFNSILKIKYGDGVYDLTVYYEQKANTVDVLFLGSSHAFENFNTGVLWDEYGMSSYVLGGAVQPMWNTYYYLKEALKTQTPQVIVLEAYCTLIDCETDDDSIIIKNNYGLKWSWDKIESIKTSAQKKRWPEFFLEYIQYHNRYSDLSKADFLDYQGDPLYINWKGFLCNMDVWPCEYYDVSGVTERKELYGKTERYFRYIIGLARENNIPIVVVIAPYQEISDEAQKVFNKVQDISFEMGVPYINCNLLVNEIGIDYSTDAADPSHLNYNGSIKLSNYIGDYLTNLYSITDHRGDLEYSSWQENADYIRAFISDNLCED